MKDILPGQRYSDWLDEIIAIAMARRFVEHCNNFDDAKGILNQIRGEELQNEK